MAGAQTTDHRKRFAEEPIDGQAFKELAEAALTWLKTNSEIVNALNVFPVPDGDTGTNMLLTMQAAFDEIKDLPEKSAGIMATSLAHGALMGARGNSGVILSQLLRGFARALDGEGILTPEVFANAFSEARDTAYRGVVRPVEGTILTVSKDAAAAAENAVKMHDDVVSILEHVVKAADESVENTPNLLPVLKDAGVVDSGGKGYFFLIEGMLRYINGEDLDTALMTVQPLSGINFDEAMDEVEEGQDYEVIVDFRPGESFELRSFYARLEEMGVSIQVGEGDGIYRMHIHTPIENRYMPIEYIEEIGTVTKVYMENLLDQMDDIGASAKAQVELTPAEPGRIAIVTVSPGDGISRVFASLGVNAIVAGGQTMNPSTKEILAAFEDMPTDKIIILPNNKNIVMASKAAVDLTVKQVAVVSSRTIPQGLAAMLSFDPEGDFDEIVEAMEEAMQEVETGEVTTATRTVEIDGVQVHDGQTIALHNGKLVSCDPSIEECVLNFLRHIQVDDYELITMFYGAGLKLKDAEAMAETISAEFPEHEVEIQEGGQNHYQFIFSIE